MKLTTVAAALVGLSVGSALAAHNTNVAQANNTQPALVQGNSVMPDMQTNLGKHLWAGGMINADALYATDYALTGHSGYTDWTATGKHANTDLYLNNANIIVGGKLGFMSAVVNLVSGFSSKGNSGTSPDTSSVIQVDEAYVNFYDFSQLPIYAKVGKFYTQYGDYNPYAQFPGLTTALTEVQANAGVELGASHSVHNATVFINGTIFGGDTNRTATSNGVRYTKLSNFTINGGVKGQMRGVTYQLDGGYLNKTGDLSYAGPNNSGFGAGAAVLGSYTPAGVGTPAKGGYNGHGYNAHLGLGYVMPNNPQQAITVGVKFAGISGDIVGPVTSTKTKSPWALDATADYHFYALNYNHVLGGIYGHAANVASTGVKLPNNRFGAHFGTMWNKYLSTNITYLYAKADKNFTNTSKEESNNLFGVEVAVKF